MASGRIAALTAGRLWFVAKRFLCVLCSSPAEACGFTPAQHVVRGVVAVVWVLCVKATMQSNLVHA